MTDFVITYAVSRGFRPQQIKITAYSADHAVKLFRVSRPTATVVKIGAA